MPSVDVKVETVVKKTVTLTMDETEAMILRAILGKVGGSPKHPEVSRFTCDAAAQLNKQGFNYPVDQNPYFDWNQGLRARG